MDSVEVWEWEGKNKNIFVVSKADADFSAFMEILRDQHRMAAAPDQQTDSAWYFNILLPVGNQDLYTSRHLLR